jgi:hypothetical protein
MWLEWPEENGKRSGYYSRRTETFILYSNFYMLSSSLFIEEIYIKNETEIEHYLKR